MAKEDRFAIIRYLVDRLKDVGKTRIQKIVYFLQHVFGIPLDYVFRMHYYGPYSEELNDDLIEMKLHDYIDITPNPTGYGYHIRPSSEVIDSMENTIKNYGQELENCLEKFGQLEPQKLELLGTLHFVEYVARTSNKDKAKDEIVEKVATLKPVFTKSEVEESYQELESLIGAQ